MGIMEPVHLFGCCDATTAGFLDIGAGSHGSVGLLGVDCDIEVDGGLNSCEIGKFLWVGEGKVV